MWIEANIICSYLKTACVWIVLTNLFFGWGERGVWRAAATGGGAVHNAADQQSRGEAGQRKRPGRATRELVPGVRPGVGCSQAAGRGSRLSRPGPHQHHFPQSLHPLAQRWIFLNSLMLIKLHRCSSVTILYLQVKSDRFSFVFFSLQSRNSSAINTWFIFKSFVSDVFKFNSTNLLQQLLQLTMMVLWVNHWHVIAC